MELTKEIKETAYRAFGDIVGSANVDAIEREAVDAAVSAVLEMRDRSQGAWVCAKCGYGPHEHGLPHHAAALCLYEPIFQPTPHRGHEALPPIFLKGTKVRVDNYRYHGEGIVQWDTGVYQRMIGVLLENGNTWPYEVETVKLANPAALTPGAPETPTEPGLWQVTPDAEVGFVARSRRWNWVTGHGKTEDAAIEMASENLKSLRCPNCGMPDGDPGVTEASTTKAAQPPAKKGI